MLVILTPLLNISGGHKIGWKKILLLTMANFRASFALSLGLLGFLDKRISEVLRLRMIFWGTCTVLIAHSIGLIFIKPVMKALKLTKTNKARERIF